MVVGSVIATILSICSQYAIVSGGILSGGLHALSGPDHLSVLLPCIVGKHWKFAVAVGFSWGLGHGLTSLGIGLGAWEIKGAIDDYGISMDFGISYFLCIKNFAFGITLIVIGVMGIFETVESVKHEGEPTQEQACSSTDRNKYGAVGIYFLYCFNGCLLGFSVDGFPSLAPTLAINQMTTVLLFLVCYCIGTAVFMGIASGGVAHASACLGDLIDSRLPSSLALVSSIFSIMAGLFWLMYGVVSATLDSSDLEPYIPVVVIFATLGSITSTCTVIYAYHKTSPLCATLLAPLVYHCKVAMTSFSSTNSLITPPKSHVYNV
mmetsp:Transcript_791/g.1318  ORF Transcript_791/g.1318 Transcript_791/m.1318 type:complete len:321 (+) Transcript_791:158-1120(+)